MDRLRPGWRLGPGWLGSSWLALALGALAALLFVSGCPALMIPSLGYEAYEYHETGHLPGMPSTSQNSKPTAQSTSEPQIE